VPYQIAVTVRAPVRPTEIDRLKAALREIADEGRRPRLLPFEDLAVHFARFVVLDPSVDLDGNEIAPSLMFMADIDSPRRRFFCELAVAAADGLDEIFGHCEGYPASPSVRERVAYLRQHQLKAATSYVNIAGKPVREIQAEAKLRAAIETFLDRRNWTGQSSDEVRRAVIDFVAADQTLAWALQRRRRPSLWWRLKETAHLLASAALLLLMLPFFIVALPVLAVTLRLHEIRDGPSNRVPDPVRLDQLDATEDFLVQNQFSAVGFVKPGDFRRITLTLVLWLLELSARHVYNNGSLAGIKTIHFARWVFLDDKRRLIFISNYDGSLESYMDDFIDKVAWGLNAAFSNGEGYPRTRWLVLDGAKDEAAFKNYLRDHQILTQVWYSAYGDLTAVNIVQNAAIRRGLRGHASEADAQQWAALL
jgi:hypothetical protein